MIYRLDAHPDAHGQMMEIVRHYGRMAARREDERLIEAWPRMGQDARAAQEYMGAMERRAERTGRTAAEEGRRWQRRHEDRLKVGRTEESPLPVARRRGTNQAPDPEL